MYISDDDAGGSVTIARVRRIQLRGGRLTGEMVAAIIDDEDITFRFCVCGHAGFYHPSDGCQACDSDEFVEREEFQ